MVETVTFAETVLRSYPTGSRYICNPPPVDTDNDTIFLVNGFFDYWGALDAEGWEDCGPDYDTAGQFLAFRKGEENYIVTEDPTFFESYIRATEGAKALNLLDKNDRIKLFKAVAGAGQGYIGFMTKFPIDAEAVPAQRWIHDPLWDNEEIEF